MSLNDFLSYLPQNFNNFQACRNLKTEACETNSTCLAQCKFRLQAISDTMKKKFESILMSFLKTPPMVYTIRASKTLILPLNFF
jgi:hypothetical protein